MAMLSYHSYFVHRNLLKTAKGLKTLGFVNKVFNVNTAALPYLFAHQNSLMRCRTTASGENLAIAQRAVSSGKKSECFSVMRRISRCLRSKTFVDVVMLPEWTR